MKERIRVLYAEDHPPDADLTKAHFELSASEFEFEIVDTGHAFLARVQEQEFDVLLLDNHLPDMDGVEVLKELGENEASLPVVMVTGIGDESLVVQVLRLGAVDYIPKTGNYLEILPSVLRSAVSEYRSRKDSGQLAGRRQRRVLYLEHHQADIDLTLKYFSESAAHFTFEVVPSAARALACLEKAHFDLVLADLRIPGMNALEFLRETKHRGMQIPVIIVTGRGDEAAAAAALKLGAYDYIVKRDNYLTHLPYAIDNAIARAQLLQMNRRLQHELAQKERAQAENARLLAEVLGQRRRVEEIVASIPGIVWEAWGPPDQPDQKIAYVSDQVEEMLGYTVDQWLSTGNFWLSIVHPDDRSRAAHEAAEIFASGKGGVSQFRWLGKSGNIVWVEARSTVICDESGKPLGLRGVTMDITANKDAEQARLQLELQLRQAQKMESIGRVAGGVAHDFNNLLTAINGYADLMLGEMRPSDPLRSRIEEIRGAGERGAELIRQLLAFSRRQILQPRILQLNSLITGSLQILKRLLGEDVELVTRLDPELGHVKADSGQMDQVILNLAVNARDAMPRGGRLTLETRNVRLDAKSAQQQLSLQPGQYVVLAISDTGCGIDAQTASQIFEPFFTTKEQGKGTGLGLSTVYGIVKQSDGSIAVRSEPGNGSTFEVYLPRVEGTVATAESKHLDPESPRGSETVLVVEDEMIVLKLASTALRKYGYEVLEAASGAEALSVCKSHQGRISLMIADVVMPQMSGPELARQLKSQYPNLRVLYMSGHTDDGVLGQGLFDQAKYFLQKPFTPNALARKVREVLDQGANAQAH